MRSITFFTWGYWGWGNATKELVRAVDTAEARRGFNPPVFVDIRISRSVRAIGFNGTNFGRLVGTQRYHWLDDLGNLTVLDGLGDKVRIKDPKAAATLLTLGLEAASSRRRLIFYCSCEFPRKCHRSHVTRLLLKAAEGERKRVTVVEWPGGEPTVVQLHTPGDVGKRLLRGTRSVPVSAELAVSDYASLPWGSVATLDSPDGRIGFVTGPAKVVAGQWCLPVPNRPMPVRDLEGLIKEGHHLRAELGLNERSSK